jgi:hypothetical protein
MVFRNRLHCPHRHVRLFRRAIRRGTLNTVAQGMIDADAPHDIDEHETVTCR